jgi:hypothetical protein
MTRRASIVFQIATLGTVAMFASAPTPFYRIYQDHWHLSPVMVTTVFSAYALNLLVALHLLSPSACQLSSQAWQSRRSACR